MVDTAMGIGVGDVKEQELISLSLHLNMSDIHTALQGVGVGMVLNCSRLGKQGDVTSLSGVGRMERGFLGCEKSPF